MELNMCYPFFIFDNPYSLFIKIGIKTVEKADKKIY